MNSVVESVRIVDREHQAPAHHHDGMHTIQFVILVINKEIKVSLVPSVAVLTELLHIKRW